MELEGGTAVVIGGGSGIGRGIALGLANNRMNVLVADIDAASAERVAEELRVTGVSAEAHEVDGTNPASLATLAEAASSAMGRVDVLSNNVGVVIDKPLTECTDDDWAWGIEFNLLSIIRGVQAFLPHLRRNEHGGHIVNTASLAGVLALPTSPTLPVHLGIYTATKHAIVAYSEMLRGELAAERIGVSVLCPGMVRSNLSRTTARHRPERYGGPLPDPGPTAPQVDSMMMPAEEVGPIVASAIRANRLHIFTHPEARPMVEARQQAMLDDFSFASSRRSSKS